MIIFKLRPLHGSVDLLARSDSDWQQSIGYAVCVMAHFVWTN